MKTLLVTTSLLLLTVLSCTDVRESKQPQLRIEIVSSREVGSMVEVKVKFTNVSDKHINSAKGTAIIYDKNHNEIGFQEDYVIKSTEGGLKPNATARHSFIVDVNGKFSKVDIEYKIL